MRRVDANDDGVMDLREFEAYFERTSRALYAFRCRQRKQEKKQCAALVSRRLPVPPRRPHAARHAASTEASRPKPSGCCR